MLAKNAALTHDRWTRQRCPNNPNVGPVTRPPRMYNGLYRSLVVTATRPATKRSKVQGWISMGLYVMAK